ncbi:MULTISPECIES: bacteriocin [unclassified Tenacibaculum]|uniref:bacteriocin n=1 Tax=unclassified Tenacibaculum TaxID=2635139 RepID=UPI001F400BF7|nr:MULTISPECIES: bacteriocin [unclassified Tenacibaculum]MCF2873991.1 bacteriocin [Tenacibaculum sp. Cn5-1]MCF2934572.1 bacteriocin [Tenacibaculum sp. Cn5-34]MCG7510782.1 bacteriocin [Tenacibaculum sp. Cn5-46]
MSKKILKLNDVKELNKAMMKQISGGANEYLCFKADGSSFSSTTDVSSSSINCSIVAEVVAPQDDYFEFNYHDHIRP